MRTFSVFLVIVCLFPAVCARAAAAYEENLPAVEVRAKEDQGSITSPGIQDARQKISLIPGGAAVVDSGEYKKGRASTVKDALEYVPGVYVQPRFGSEESRLSIRGSGIQRTFHLRGIKLLQDGVPINQADGGGDFQNIDPLAYKYIEVYRGANALRYGGTTLGGAVNFVTPTGYDADLIQGRFEIGGYNYLKGQVSSGAVYGPFDYYVSASHFSQDGFRNHSEQDTRRIFTNAGRRFNDHAETRFYVTLADSKSQLPGSLTKTQMHQNPAQANPSNLSGNQKRDYDYVQAANKTTFTWGEQTLETALFWFRKDLFHPIFQVLDVVSNDAGGSIRYQNFKQLFERKNIFTAGFVPVFGTAYDTRSVNTGGRRGARTAYTKQKAFNLDAYAENQHYVLPALAAVTGVQWSYAGRKLDDRFLSDGDNSGAPVYQAFSPKAGLRYEITEDAQIFMNFSRSFEPPSFGELVRVSSGGIADLRAQRASTLEFGTRGSEGRVRWDAAWYYSWVDDELLSLNDPSGNPLGTVNADDTSHQGLELGAEVDLLRGIVPFFAGENEIDRVFVRAVYNWSRFRFEDHPVSGDNQLPGIPEHSIRSEIVYEHPSGVYFGPNMEWILEKYPVDMANTLFARQHVLFGVRGGWRMKNGVSFFVEGRNLTNETYAAATGVIANAGGLDSPQFFPGDGRAVYSGIEVRWG